jgi:hypothetical protein
MKSVTKTVLRLAAATAAAGTLTAGALAASASAATVGEHGYAASYRFTTLDNDHDVTFNQLLGINNEGVIAGYFGSGAQGHPNKGYLLLPPYSQYSYHNENFPHSVQTQVTGLNDHGVTVGFWSTMNTASMNNNNFGFVNVDGHFENVNFPAGNPASPPVDQLLGVNDSGIAVGFYTDGNSTNHGYEYNIWTHRFSVVTDPADRSASLTAAAINNHGDVAGVYVNRSKVTDGFLKTRWGRFITLSVPGASSTMALGVNDSDEVVGVFTPSSNANALEGFTWTPWHGFSVVNDPNGPGTTTINGVNDAGDLVGFYVDAAGNTDGFLAAPRH